MMHILEASQSQQEEIMIIPEPGTNEKRGFPRMTMNTPITFSFNGEDIGRNGFCKDLSHTGICFTTKNIHSEKTHLELTIDTNYSGFKPFKAKVEILRSELAGTEYSVAGKILTYN